MKIILFFISILISGPLLAQFAIISDKDGFSNIRKAAGVESKIIDTLNNGHLVYRYETKDNWISITYSKKSQELIGYIYHDRLLPVEKYENIPQIPDCDSIFSKDSIKVTISRESFVRSKYRLTYFKDAPSNIQYINGKLYWGMDGELPRIGYKSVFIIIGQRKTILPRAAIEDLFEAHTKAAGVHYDRENDILYIQSIGGDGAGYYEVIWKIEKGKYVDRYIAYGF